MSDVPLPPTATNRLSSGTSMWTTALGVDDLEAVIEAGFRPSGVVVGTAMCRVPLAPLRSTHSVELGMLTQTILDARQSAVSRMVAEAAILEADGVVGVDVQVLLHAGGGDAIEVLATGSAVHAAKPTDGVWTAALTGHELAAVKRCGYRPLRVVFGVCVYHVAHRVMQQTPSAGPNAEIHQYTQALYDGRELAVARMQGDAGDAAGVLGVHVDTSPRLWGDQAIEFLATGTAVATA